MHFFRARTVWAVALLLLAIPSAFAACTKHCARRARGPTTVAIGSYTSQSWLPTSAGQGVAILSLATAGPKRLTQKKILGPKVTGANPSYCAKGQAKRIFCANENDPGTVSSISTAREAGSSTPTGVTGAGTAYVAAISKRRVVAANYKGGSVTAFKVKASGKLVRTGTFQAPKAAVTGESPQEAPHMHMVLEISPGVILVPDLGSDVVWELKVSGRGKLSKRGMVKVEKGDGPRHAVLHKRSGNVFVVAELSNTIITLGRGCSKGGYGKQLQTCSRTPLLPPGRLTGGSAAAIRLSRDGRFVYASVRAEGDTDQGVIVGFKVVAGQVKERIGIWKTGGVHPRDFALVDGKKGGAVVLVANRDSNNVVAFRRNARTGVIGKCVGEIEVKTPTSVLVM